jgi:hypothetical protein
MPGPELGQELADRRVRRQWGEQLDARAGVPDGHHRLAHALLLVDLLVQAGHAVGVAVEGDGGVEVGHGDAHVVDHREQGGPASIPLSLWPRHTVGHAGTASKREV